MTVVSASTAAALTGIAALHAAWGAGSAFPLADRSEVVVASDAVDTEDVLWQVKPWDPE